MGNSFAVLFFCAERFEDLIRAHIDVAAAEGEYQIAVLRVFLNIFRNLVEGVDTQAAGNLRAEIGVIDIVGVGFAHRKNLGDNRDVGNRQRLSKVVEQERGTAERMRLENRPYLFVAHFHRRGQRRGQLGGVVGEVVRYGDSSRRAENLKASVNARKGVQILRNLCGGRAEIMRGRRRSKRVVDIMPAGYLKRDVAELFALVHQVEFLVRALDISQVFGVVIVGFAEAERNHRQGDVLDRVEDILVVAVVDNHARRQVAEFVEGFFDIVKGLEVVEVVCVDIENHGDIGGQLEEGVDILARLADDNIALTDIAVAADKGQLAADDCRGVEARADQKLAEHSGGGRLAVRTRYRNTAVISAGDNAEHDAALDCGNSLFLCRCQLGVVGLYRCGIDDKLRALDIFGFVTHVYLDAVALDTVERVALIHIGAGQLKALAVQNLGERTHTRAADADEVNPFDIIQKMVVVHNNPLMYSMKLSA